MGKRSIYYPIILILILAGCTTETPEPTATAISARPTSTATNTNTPTPVPPTATNTATATSTSTETPTLTPTPTETSTPTPTPTPAPELQQLTTGGCCSQPFFSADNQQVLFIDKPSANDPVGIYGVTITNPETTPRLVSDIIGFRSKNQAFIASAEGPLIRVIEAATDESWLINTGGNWPIFSQNGRRLLWVASDLEGPYDQRQSDVWLADSDGDNQQRLFTTFGARNAEWFPDNERILMIGRDLPSDEERVLFIYDVETGNRTNLYSHDQIRGGDISPGGQWVTYFVTFADDPTENGLWIVDAESGQRRKIELPTFGDYQWRDDNTLIFIPFRESVDKSMQLWQIDANSGALTPLIEPSALSFSISNGDWDISPDGQYITFVNSEDQNIWLIGNLP